jgi:hypothetical protein
MLLQLNRLFVYQPAANLVSGNISLMAIVWILCRLSVFILQFIIIVSGKAYLFYQVLFRFMTFILLGLFV